MGFHNPTGGEHGYFIKSTLVEIYELVYRAVIFKTNSN